MKLTHLHIYLESCNIVFWHLTEDFKHVVYCNKATGKKYTFPKIEDSLLDPELVRIGCLYLGCEVPNEVEELLKSYMKK